MEVARRSCRSCEAEGELLLELLWLREGEAGRRTGESPADRFCRSHPKFSGRSPL